MDALKSIRYQMRDVSIKGSMQPLDVNRSNYKIFKIDQYAENVSIVVEWLEPDIKKPTVNVYEAGHSEDHNIWSL